MENSGIVVDDSKAKTFCVELGLELLDDSMVEGDRVDVLVPRARPSGPGPRYGR